MARFFFTSSQVDEIEISEFLLKRYGTLAFMETMDVSFFVRFYNKAKEKDTEEKVYMQWCAMLPQMAKFITFSEFLDKATGRNVDTRPTEEILKELEELRQNNGS